MPDPTDSSPVIAVVAASAPTSTPAPAPVPTPTTTAAAPAPVSPSTVVPQSAPTDAASPTAASSPTAVQPAASVSPVPPVTPIASATIKPQAPVTPSPTYVPPILDVAPKTAPGLDLAKAKLEGKPEPYLGKSNVANLPHDIAGTVAPLPSAAPKPPKGLPDPAPFRFDIDQGTLDESKLAESISAAKVEYAASAPAFGSPVAHQGYPAHGFLQGYDASTGMIKVMFVEAKGNPADSVEFPKADLFDPRRAVEIYRSLVPTPEVAK